MRTARALAGILLCVLSACTRVSSDTATPVLVFAASDLRDALSEVAREYRATGGDSVVLVFGSTGDLAAQIANGAPADVFFAANAKAIDDLAAKKLVIDSSRAVYAIGRVALVARCDANRAPDTPCPTLALADLAGPNIRSVAIADPSHAPYGAAAKQALERSGLWSQVQPKLVLGANVSQAEQFVSTGNADAGLIALSLVLRTPGRAYALVDTALHDPLRQTVAILAESKRTSAAVKFLRFLAGDTGRTLMKRYGFTAPGTLAP